MPEAFVTALRVGLEGAIAGALGWAVLRPSGLRRVAWPFAAAVALGPAAGFAFEALAAARGLAPSDVAPALHRAQGLQALALAALALLARGRSADALAAGRARPLAEVAALAAGLLVLLPEGAFLAADLADLAVLRGAAGPVGAAAAGGALLAAGLGAGAAHLWARAGVGRWLGPSAALSLLLGLELAGVAATAVGAHTLPLAVTGGISRAIHDAVHLVFVMLQVPDHAFLEDWAYQLILEFLEPAVHAALAAAVVAAPIAAAWRAFARRPAPPAPPAARAPERRIARAGFLRATRLGALPFAAALLLEAGAIWSARAQGDELYEPVPEPVVDDGAGHVVVPLGGGPIAASEDRMRKWVYSAGARAVTFFTVRRPDGSLAAALDLCEICQPKGYAQMGPGYVFCIYCKTPIPAGTVGQPGGCNPIPIPATLSGSTLLVPRDALVRAFEKGMADKR